MEGQAGVEAKPVYAIWQDCGATSARRTLSSLITYLGR